jgi:SAM-dependent methyltransferase
LTLRTLSTSGTSDVYVTDVPYLRQFCRELSPPLLRAAAALGGFRTSSAATFDYLELGSGMGDTLCTLAAAHPHARFIGVDINREHVAFARAMADRGGLSNVRLLEDDLEALAQGDGLPELDFVCAHGLLSWISPEKRRAVIDLAASRLKPGGLLYVSYNAMPGWAAVQPLRRLLHELAGPQGSTAERAQRALQAATALRDHGAKYFADNPAAGEMLDTMARVGPAYVVHEYFHDHWYPMHFADVAGEMAAAGLGFCAELPLYRNVAGLALPGATRALVEAVADRIAGGTLKDYAANTFFRGDVYIKATAAPDPSAASEYLDATRFGTTVTAERIHREVNFPHSSLALHGEPFDTILGLAVAAPVTVEGLQRALPMFDAERIREALVDLVASDQIVPLVPEVAGRSEADAHAYNLAVLAEPLSASHPVVLAAPLAGTGLAVPPLQAVCLRLLHLVAPGARAAWLRAFVERQPVKLHVRDHAVTDKQQQAQILEAELERFRAQRLPKLEQLGVVRPATH